MPGILDALQDPEFRRQMGVGVSDAANRGAVAGTFGAPVDMATTLSNLLIAGGGYIGHRMGLLGAPPDLIDSRDVPMSSEWIGQQMQNSGLVSEYRNPVAEALAAIAIPLAMQKGAGALGGQLAKAEQVAATQPKMRAQSQRGVIEFPSGMTRDQKRAQVQKIAEDAADRLNSMGFRATVDHSGSAMGPSSYVRVYDPQTGRFITDPLRISDHSKGAFNSTLVHDARGPEDIDAFIKVAQDMRALGPSSMLKQQQAEQLAHAEKVRESWMAVYQRALQKQQDGQQLSNKERQSIDWVRKNGSV